MSANPEAIGGLSLRREAGVADAPDTTEPSILMTDTRANLGRDKKRRLAYFAASTLLIGGGVTCAAAGGAAIGALRPIEIQPTEHIEASLQLRQADRTDFTLLQPELTIQDTQSVSNLPIIGQVAPHITMTKFDYAGFSELPGVLSDYQGTIKESRQQVKRNVVTRGALTSGLAIASGLAVAGLAVLDNKRIRRRRREQQAAATIPQLLTPSVHTSLPEFHTAIDDLKSLAERRTLQPHRVLLCGALAVSLVGGVSLATAKHELSSVKAPESATTGTPLPANLIHLFPQEDQTYLSNITVSGSGGHLLNKATRFLLEQKRNIDEYWQGVSQQTAEQFASLRKQGKLPWENDPNQVSVLAVSDIHGNMSYLKNAMPGLVNSSLADIVVNAGDQENTSGNFIMDNESLRALTKTVDPNTLNGRQVPIVFVSGNHDSTELPRDILKNTYTDGSNNKYHPIIPLTRANGYKTEVDGLTFVGGPDPNRTTTGPTMPLLQSDQYANSAKLGQTITDVACQTKAESNINPIVITHEREAGYQALATGCASIAISGHLHSIHKPINYGLSDGNYSYLENLGSSSGDGPNNPTAIYNKATTPGNAILNIFDKTTGLLTNFVTITYTPIGSVEVRVHKAGAPRHGRSPIDSTKINRFLTQHNLKPAMVVNPSDSQDTMIMRHTRIRPAPSQ